MKLHYIITVVILIFVIAGTLPTNVQAQPDGMLFQRGPILKEKMNGLKEMVQERKILKASSSSERKNQLTENKRNRIGNYLEKIFNRFEASTERLETLSNRIQSRIDKFEEKEVDTKEAQNKLDEANNLIEEAKKSISITKTTLEESLNGSDEIIKKEIRENITESKNAIKLAHAELIKAVVILKGSDFPENSEE